MLSGSHIVVYSQDADADREFFSDILKLPAIDAGGGWLIFALPPAEVAFHPAETNNTHELYLMCENLADTIKELENRGVHCEDPSEQDWGILTQILLPGGGHLSLYQPLHPTAY